MALKCNQNHTHISRDLWIYTHFLDVNEKNCWSVSWQQTSFAILPKLLTFSCFTIQVYSLHYILISVLHFSLFLHKQDVLPDIRGEFSSSGKLRLILCCDRGSNTANIIPGTCCFYGQKMKISYPQCAFELLKEVVKCKFSIHVSKDSDSKGVGWGAQTCIFNKFFKWC